MDVYFISGQNYNIEDSKEVKVIRFEGNNSYMVKDTKNKQNGLNKYKKLNKNECVDTLTGEIIKYKEKEERDKSNMARSLTNLKYTIRNNFVGNSNELFITLTTEYAIQDYDIVKNKAEKFIKELRQIYKGLEYIYVLELQEDRNSWHIHILLKDTIHKTLYINYDEVDKLWGSNGTNIEHIYEIEGLANYFSKAETKTKIPRNKKMYYKSRGIKKAEIKKKIYKEFKEEVQGEYSLTNEYTLNIKNAQNDYTINRVKTETWTNIHNKK